MDANFRGKSEKPSKLIFMVLNQQVQGRGTARVMM